MLQPREAEVSLPTNFADFVRSPNIMTTTSLEEILEQVEFLSPYTDNCRCCYCKQILLDPKKTDCNHLFCSNCLAQLFGTGNPKCPIDGKVIIKGQICKDEFTKEIVMQMEVTCPHKGYGCNKILNLRSLQEHILSCIYASLLCPQGCQQFVRKTNLINHLQTDCSRQPVKCQFCSEDVLKANLKEHTDICPIYPISCPYQCGCTSLPRHEMKIHAEKCTARPYRCKFSQIGCQFEGLEDVVSSHEQDILFHMELMVLHNMRRDYEQELLLNEMKAELAESHRENLILKDRMEQTGETMGIMMQHIEKLGKALVSVKKALKVSTRTRNVAIGNDTSVLKVDDLEDKIEELCDTVKDLEMQVQQGNALKDQSKPRATANEATGGVPLNDLELRVQRLESTTYDGIFTWKIKDFWQRLEDAAAGKSTCIYSVPFYNKRYGYKMCLRVFPNGEGHGKGSYLSIYLVLMKGQMDSLLPWPFQHKITFMLLDQLNCSAHIRDSIQPDPRSPSFRRPVENSNSANGLVMFVTHDLLRESPLFIVNNTIFLKVIIHD